MKGNERRVATLEERRRARHGTFSHFSDADLQAAGIDLIEQLRAAGANLSADWRERYSEDAVRVLTELGSEMNETPEEARVWLQR